MTRYIRLLSLLLITSLSCCGCGPSKPAGVPALSPIAITIVKESAPVVNANVFLVADGQTPSGSWSTMGITDEQGKATIETSQGDWKASGAPAGEYKVYITKVGKIEEPEQPADMDENEEAKAAFFAERLKRLEAAGKEIPKALTSTDTSNLKVTVSESGSSETFDISQYGE